MDPLTGAALINVGGNLVGGLLGNRAQSSANAANARLTREGWQKQIQYRVADAKAAGLHPLAALGINPASSPIPQLPEVGVGDAISSSSRDLSQAMIRKVEAETDFIRQQTLAAARAKVASPGTATIPSPGLHKEGPPSLEVMSKRNPYSHENSDPRIPPVRLPGVDTTISTPFGDLLVSGWPQGQALEDQLGEGGSDFVSMAAVIDALARAGYRATPFSRPSGSRAGQGSKRRSGRQVHLRDLLPSARSIGRRGRNR